MALLAVVGLQVEAPVKAVLLLPWPAPEVPRPPGPARQRAAQGLLFSALEDLDLG